MTPAVAIAARRQSRFRAIGTLARTAFCNKCVGRLASSCNRRIFFIGAPFLAVGYGRRASSTRPRLAFAVHKLRGPATAIHTTPLTKAGVFLTIALLKGSLLLSHRLYAAMRETETQEAVQAWFEVDPASARAWLANSNLDDEIKRRFLAPQG